MDFRQEIEGMKRALVADMPDLEVQDPIDIRRILVTYRDVFAPHFIPWIEWTRHGCKSDVAYLACCDNLDCEITEDHPFLLRDFAYWSETGWVRSCQTFIDAITVACRSDPMEGLLILAALENLSLVFIPWMQCAADKLGIDKPTQEYLRKHGADDAAHAEDFLKALEAEAKHHSQKRLLGLVYVKRLLHNIFWECD